MKALLLVGILFQQLTTTGGSIAGRVLFSDGEPAAGVAIVALPLEGGASGTARTNASGEYRIRNLSPGGYHVRTALAEPVTFYPGTAAPSEAVAITVTTSAVENVSFSLTPSASGVRIAGRVIVAENQPIEERILLSSRSPFQFRSATMSADGAFEFLHIRPGNYSLELLVPGMEPLPFTVADRDVADIEVRVPKLAAVRGTITSDRAGPLSELKLIFEGPAIRVDSRVQPDGNFTALMPAGSYSIRIDDIGANQYLRSLTTDSADLLKEPLKIPTPDATIQIAATIATSSGVKVSGRVMPSGDPEEAVPSTIALLNPITNHVAEGLINEDRSFELKSVIPGTYVGAVSSKGSSLPSPRISLVVPPTDVTDLEIAVPGLKEVSGRVTVEGSGPAPKSSFVLVRGGEGLLTAAPDTSQLPVLSVGSRAALRSANLPNGLQVLKVDVNALADGTFKIKLPIGEYRIAQQAVAPDAPATASSALPSAYFLKSMTYGDAHVITEPLLITESDSPELQIGFGTTKANPWVTVRGRVTGMDSSKGPFRVALDGSVTSTIETTVHPDGSFQFNAVMRGATYTARLVPAHAAATTPKVIVGDKDVSNVEIAVPPEKEVIVRIAVENNAPLPGFILSLAGSTNTMSTLVRPERDGTFKIKLPGDERKVTLRGLPVGYEVKALAYGSTDLLKLPLRVAGTDSAELTVSLATDPNVPFGSLKGRVTGLDPELRSVRLVLNDAAAFSTFEAAVNPDGSFSFSKIPQGTYTASIPDGVVSGRLTPTSILVTGIESTTVEIQAPPQDERTTRSPVIESPSGATVMDLAGGNRETVNESAAIGMLRTINTALVTYLSASGGKYGNLQDLIDTGMLDQTMTQTKSGFKFSIISIGTSYAAAAIPATPDDGRYGYYSTPDAIVRYSPIDFLSPPNQSGEPVQ